MERRGCLVAIFSLFRIGHGQNARDNIDMEAPEVNYVKSAKLVKVVDGDTLRVVIDLGWDVQLKADVRLAGVNAPESRGYEREAGKFVTQQVVGWLAERTLKDPKLIIYSKSYSSGKFGRTLAEVWADGESLNEYLLNSKLAWKIDDNGKQIEPREIESLDLPESVLETFAEKD